MSVLLVTSLLINVARPRGRVPDATREKGSSTASQNLHHFPLKFPILNEKVIYGIVSLRGYPVYNFKANPFVPVSRISHHIDPVIPPVMCANLPLSSTSKCKHLFQLMFFPTIIFHFASPYQLFGVVKTTAVSQSLGSS